MKYENKTLHNSNIIIIAAADEAMGIGLNGSIPWDVAEDRAHFKRLTMGHPLLVGRKTFESFGSHPLPGRPLGVLTHSLIPSAVCADDCCAGEEFVWSCQINSLIKWSQLHAQPTYAAGGAQLYKLILPFASEILLSRIPGCYNCDTNFPEIPEGFVRVNVEKKKTFILEKFVFMP